MNILITGATGCLGRNLTLHLAGLGHKVQATGRNLTIGNILEEKNIRFYPRDLSSIDNLDEIFKNQEIVFHCAALSSPWGKYHDFYQANVVATQNVINHCHKHQIKRLIHVSTPSIYFDFTDRYNIKEEDVLPLVPVNYYAKTKLLAEQAIDQAHQSGLEVITIRPRAIFGPYDTTLMPRLIKATLGGKFPLIDGGNNIVDITFVGNVIQALLLCMEAKDAALGQKFNITNGSPIILKELLSKTFKALDIGFSPGEISYSKAMMLASLLEFIANLPLMRHEPRITKYAAGVLSKSQTLDISKARNILGYQPQYTIDQAIYIYAKWYKEHNAS